MIDVIKDKRCQVSMILAIVKIRFKIIPIFNSLENVHEIRNSTYLLSEMVIYVPKRLLIVKIYKNNVSKWFPIFIE